MSVIYHEVKPDNNNTDGFSEFNTLDFTLIADGRKMKPNSLRIDFEAEVFITGSTRVTDDTVRLDSSIGAHAFIESYQTEIQSVGVIENLQEAPRFHSVHGAASLNQNDFFDAKYQAEGRQTVADCGAYVIQQVAHQGSETTAHFTNPSFSLAPKMCLNRMVGDSYSFSKNGYIKVSCNLARVGHALNGSGMVADTSYKLKNVVCRFTSEPDDGKQGKIMMNSAVMVKTAVQSTQASILARVPSKAVNGVMMSYIEQSAESDPKQNNTQLQSYPQIDSISYRFNDATNKYVTYEIRDRADMLRKGLEALTEGGFNQVNAKNVLANQGTIHGLPFQEYVDLSSQKFAVEIKSSNAGISSNPRIVFLFFLTLIEL